MNKRLYRSVRVRTISGVAGGLADYFDVDVSLIRLLWVLGTLFTGGFPGVILYLIATVIIPDEGEVFRNQEAQHFEDSGPNAEAPRSWDSRKGTVIFGAFLVIVGALLLMQRVFPQFIRWAYMWPLVLIVIGIAIVAGSFNRR